MHLSLRLWLSIKNLAEMTGYSKTRILALARKGKIPGRRPGSRPSGCRLPDTPERRVWVAAMARGKRAKGCEGIEASKALMKFQAVYYARSAPLEGWRLEGLEGFRFELAEIIKIHGDVCRAIEAKQVEPRVHAA